MNNIWSKECDSLVIGGKKVLQWHCKTMQEMKFENYYKCSNVTLHDQWMNLLENTMIKFHSEIE